MKNFIGLKNRAVRKFNDVSLKNKLLLLFGFTTFFQIAISIFLNVITTRNIFMDTFSEYTNDMLYNLGNSARIHLENVENVSRNTLYNQRIYEILKADTAAENRLKTYEEQREINEILKELSYHQSEIQSIYLFNNNENCYSMNSWESIYEQKRLLEGVEDAEHPTWKSINGNLYMFRKICDKNTFQKIGVEVFKLKKDIFLGDIGRFADFEKIEIFSDNFESMYRYKENSEIQISEEEFKSVVSGRNGSYIDRKNKRFVCFSSIANLNWSIIATIRLSRFYSKINLVRNMILIFGLLTCLLVLLFDLIFYKNMLVPIERLIGSIKNFEQTNRINTVVSDRDDEIGFLEEKYNDLIRHLDGLIHDVYKERISRQNAQIQALQAQINPHFIYNTLETMNWMAQMRGADEISNMIFLLSKLMDVRIHAEDALVSVEKDIEYARCYCDIIKIRKGASVEFRFKVDEDIKDVLIPALTMQPLVENAVSHGIASVERIGIILIRAYKKDGLLMLEITDNGIGIESEKLCEINERLKKNYGQFSFDYISGEDGHGIGLINVNERIKLNFGTEYHIKVFSRLGHFCKIVCRIPIENGNEK